MVFRFLAMYLFGDFVRVICNRYPYRCVGLALSKINNRNRDVDHIEWSMKNNVYVLVELSVPFPGNINREIFHAYLNTANIYPDVRKQLYFFWLKPKSNWPQGSYRQKFCPSGQNRNRQAALAEKPKTTLRAPIDSPCVRVTKVEVSPTLWKSCLKRQGDALGSVLVDENQTGLQHRRGQVGFTSRKANDTYFSYPSFRRYFTTFHQTNYHPAAPRWIVGGTTLKIG